MSVNGGRTHRLTTMTGANDVTLSPDETRLAIRYSSSNQPWELYVMDVPTASSRAKNRLGTPLTAGTATKLTSSLTDAFQSLPLAGADAW